MKLTLKATRKETSDVTSFIFEPHEPLIWRAGQFLHYTLPHENADARKIERYFTISSAPFEKHVMLTTRRSEKGSTFKKTLFDLPVGGVIEADGLEGDFVVENVASELVFIAGGIGITPYRSILLDLEYKKSFFKVKLLYANRDNNVVFREELEGLEAKHKDFSIRYVMSPKRIDESLIRTVVTDLSQPLFYISGPEPMVEALEKTMLAMGIPEGRLIRDYFPGYNWP